MDNQIAVGNINDYLQTKKERDNLIYKDKAQSQVPKFGLTETNIPYFRNGIKLN